MYREDFGHTAPPGRCRAVPSGLGGLSQNELHRGPLVLVLLISQNKQGWNLEVGPQNGKTAA